MNKYFIFFLSLQFLLFSCQKDQVDPVYTDILAGEADTSYSVTFLTAPLSINVVYDAQNLYGYGIDSIDIEGDGSYDILIELDLLNPDSLHLLIGQPNPFPNCRITTMNDLEIAIDSIPVYVGLGTTAYFKFAAMYQMNDVISISGTWYKNSMVKLWQENPAFPSSTFGEWYSIHAVRYIAIRKNGKYGWMEIDATNHEDPQILSFAIEN
ncbi:MAG: hypothetical protein COA33_009255 [Fluviicola sp.]|nr:hypothetical protein [Fluviicola sp.]